MTFIVHNPRGASALPAFVASPLPEALAGLTIGILDNSKEQAAVFLQRAVELLARDGTRFVVARKPSFSRAISEDVLERLKICDLVITGLGG